MTYNQFGDLGDLDYDCIYKVLKEKNESSFQDWIEGHEYLYSERQLKLMKYCWNYY